MEEAGKSVAMIMCALIGIVIGGGIGWAAYNRLLLGITAGPFGAIGIGIITAICVGVVLFKGLHPY